MCEQCDRCAIHGYEPIPDDYYKICGECWHCFVTPDELLNKHNERCEEVGVPKETKVNEIVVCPECTHDF